MQQLLEIMQLLREKCPWDQAQTPQSLTKYAIEEAYEVENAIRQGHPQQIKEELGDLLLQIIFQSQMHAEQGLFNFDDVVDTLKQKMIRRHPHVFDMEKHDLDQEQVAQLWQEIKQQEKQTQPQQHSRLEKIKHGPALIQAQQLQQHAATLGFDWDHVDGALEKLQEEILELKQAITTEKSEHVQDELGDVLFSLINVGRKLDQNCENALLSTIHKFRTRFSYIEQRLQEQNLQPEQCDLQQLDQLWNAAKRHEKQKV